MPNENVHYVFIFQRQFIRLRAGSTIGLRATMKLWHFLTTCFVLLSTVHMSPLHHGQITERTHALARLPDYTQKHQVRSSESPTNINPETADGGELSVEQYNMEDLQPEQFDDVMEFIKVTISRLQSYTLLDRSLRIRSKRERRKQGKGPAGGKKRGRFGGRGGRRAGANEPACGLKQIHLNVTDLGLGYQTSEEMIFRYCSGPCRISETNYDKILNNLTQNKRLLTEKPPQACCRPVAYDDDLSFLDDNLMYHTMKKHSARKCGCV